MSKTTPSYLKQSFNNSEKEQIVEYLERQALFVDAIKSIENVFAELSLSVTERIKVANLLLTASENLKRTNRHLTDFKNQTLKQFISGLVDKKYSSEKVIKANLKPSHKHNLAILPILLEVQTIIDDLTQRTDSIKKDYYSSSASLNKKAIERLYVSWRKITEKTKSELRRLVVKMERTERDVLKKTNSNWKGIEHDLNAIEEEVGFYLDFNLENILAVKEGRLFPEATYQVVSGGGISKKVLVHTKGTYCFEKYSDPILEARKKILGSIEEISESNNSDKAYEVIDYFEFQKIMKEIEVIKVNEYLFELVKKLKDKKDKPIRFLPWNSNNNSRTLSVFFAELKAKNIIEPTTSEDQFYQVFCPDTKKETIRTEFLPRIVWLLNPTDLAYLIGKLQHEDFIISHNYSDIIEKYLLFVTKEGRPFKALRKSYHNIHGYTHVTSPDYSRAPRTRNSYLIDPILQKILSVDKAH